MKEQRTRPYNFRLVERTRELLEKRAEREGKKFAPFMNEILAEVAEEEAKRKD